MMPNIRRNRKANGAYFAGPYLTVVRRSRAIGRPVAKAAPDPESS